MKEREYSRTKASVLNNMGGPRSRVSSEKIQKNFLQESGVAIISQVIAIPMPDGVDNPEEYLLKIARKLGFKTWEEVICKIQIPKEKRTLIAVAPDTPVSPQNGWQILLNALILAKSNPLFYMPDGEMIFSKKRLSRIVRLYEIQTTSFYEMD